MPVPPRPTARKLTNLRSPRRPTRSLIASSLVILASAASFCAFSAAPALAAGDVNTASCPAQANPSLPDCRAYEMVTPPHKNGALISSLPFRHPPAVLSEDGTRVIAPSDQCFGDPESCTSFRLTEGDPYEFERTSAGWVTHGLAPPAAVGESSSMWTVDANTGTAVFSAAGSADAPDDFFGRFEPEGPEGSFIEIGPFGEPNGGTIAQQPNQTNITVPGVLSTADLSHVVYETTSSLWSFDKESERESVYEYAGSGGTVPLMVGVEGGYEHGKNHHLVSTCNTNIAGQGTVSETEALSEDGRMVYFTAVGRDLASCSGAVKVPAVTGLYARVDGELGDAHTVLVSAPTPGGCTSVECEENTSKPENMRDSWFEGATSNGSRAFFTSPQQLTNGASEDSNPAVSVPALCGASGESGCNLYESVCGVPCGAAGEEPGAAGRELLDLSEGAKGGGGPRVQGVMAISADGTHVYFVAKGKLTGEEENQNGEKAESEEENLYLYAEGHVVFIARLAGSDEQNRQWADEREDNVIANVSPDGQFLVFMDDKALTGDDTRAGVEAEAAAQVYEYDAQTKALKRISVGEEGYNDNGNAGTGNAYIVPAFRGGASDGSVPGRLDPTMSADGELVFFESPIALVPGALNDVAIGEGHFAENVYEYYDGRVSLISDGSDTTGLSYQSESLAKAPTELLGVSASGRNVVFSTFDRLVAGDTDTQRDYYDAHICGEKEPCPTPKPAPVSCEGEACQGTSSTPPSFSTPSSLTSSGEGNLAPPAAAVVPRPKTAAQIKAEKLSKALKQCKKDRSKKKRGTCEKAARKKFGAAKTSAKGRQQHA